MCLLIWNFLMEKVVVVSCLVSSFSPPNNMAQTEISHDLGPICFSTLYPQKKHSRIGTMDLATTEFFFVHFRQSSYQSNLFCYDHTHFTINVHIKTGIFSGIFIKCTSMCLLMDFSDGKRSSVLVVWFHLNSLYPIISAHSVGLDRNLT